MDKEIQQKRKLTSANSINVARWLPQMFYYFIACQQLNTDKEKLVFSVPSGNFGNICAGLLAREMGLPIDHFIAANNINNVVERYLQSGKFEPVSSRQTISNAMDVGNPSNFSRILELYQDDFPELKNSLTGYSFTDQATTEAIAEVHKKYNYVMDPHGAVGYLGLKSFLGENPEYQGVFLETAHPVKFPDTVEKAINQKPIVPEAIQDLMDKKKKSIEIRTYDELKGFLME
jgi:threonine synthase